MTHRQQQARPPVAAAERTKELTGRPGRPYPNRPTHRQLNDPCSMPLVYRFRRYWFIMNQHA